MNEHFFHLFPSLLFFLAIGWILIHRFSLPFSKLALIGLVICLITLFTFPLHIIHASHFQMQKHDCCLPAPVEVPSVFAVTRPVETFISFNQLSLPFYMPPIPFSLNNRSPPIG